MDLHVYDAHHRHIHGGRRYDGGGGQLEADVRAGYGPECFTAVGGELAYPFVGTQTIPPADPWGTPWQPSTSPSVATTEPSAPKCARL